MAHEIHNGLCVYSLTHGGVPWHEIGEGLDTVTADDVRTYAGFNRRIGTFPITLATDGALATTEHASTLGASIAGYRATVDLSSGAVLGVVTDKYAVLQPEELLAAANFLVNEFGASYSLAAQLRDGKREVISLALPDSSAEVGSGDIVKSYFNLAQGHDGKLAVSVGSSDIRVVCANTLRAWLSEGAVQIRHRAGVEKALARAVAAFTIGANTRREFYTRMMGRKLAPAEVVRYFDAVVGEVDADSKVKRGRKSLRTRLHDMLRSDGIVGCETTWEGLPVNLWGAYNAITQMATHNQIGGNPLDSLYFGSAGTLLADASKHAELMLAA